MTLKICAAQALAHLDPNFFESLSPVERIAFLSMHDLWLRPEQQIPRHDFREFGIISGRGWGKSFAIANEINRRVEAGETKHLLLMAPTEERAEKVQINFLIETAKPYFKPERYDGGIRWPNGVQGLVFTSVEPDGARGENADTGWFTELVAWLPTKRKKAWNYATTGVRRGRAQLFWDTTSKGKNEVILERLKMHAMDPREYVIQRGTLFDNPMLSKKYIRAECAKYPPGSRGRDEELEGKVFAEAAGAFWKDDWINRSRRMVAPDLDLVIVIIDPAQSTNDDADDTGISVVGRGAIDRHAYVLRDASGKHAPEAWADIAVSECELRSSGVIIERNKIGDAALSVLRSRAKEKGFSIVSIKEDEPFPKRREKIIFVREVVAQDSKSTRAAGPASETELGHVHLVGDDFTALELELTTFEPDGRKSPNRLDAMVYGVEEIRGLARNTPSTTAAEDAAGALAANTTLRTMLPRIDGRRVGL